MNRFSLAFRGDSLLWLALYTLIPQRLYFAAVCLVLAASALANEPPAHPALPNFDKRKQEAPKHVTPRNQGVRQATVQAIPAAEPHRAVKSFVREHPEVFGHGSEALDRAAIKQDSTGRRNGARTVVWQQHLDEIPVFEGVFIAHTSREGELASVSSQFISDPQAAADRGMPNWAAKKGKLPISEEMAIVIAGRDLGSQMRVDEVIAVPEPEGRMKKYRAGKNPRAAMVRLVWAPMSPLAMRLAWEVYLAREAGGDMYRLLVDAESGEVILRHARTFYLSDATYHVFTGANPAPLAPAHPTPSTNQAPIVPRTMVTIAALSTNGSPIGWISDGESETRGNNVDAHLDRNGDDQPDLPRPQGGPGRVFDFPLDLTRSPQTYGEASAVNLFYWCNWMHDRLYELGFDEAAGNFQKDNFGRGGADNDAIIANAQDGSGVNNARFFPGPDGMAGRIEMFVFNGPDPDRDGDLDAEIILHEYTHGLTDRLVGGGIGIYQWVTFGLGEGWSDFYALALLNDGSDLDGNYTEGGYSTYQFFGLTQNYYYGIRRYPYTTDMTKNPLTFKDIDRNQITSYPSVPRSPIHPFNPLMADEPHRVGEVWCVTLWEVRANLIRKHGFPAGNELTLQLVTDGLKLSPPNPTFLQARDAILLADRLLTGGANQTELWAGFAKRGMGIGAMDSPNWTTEGIRQSFDRPDALAVVPTFGFRFSGPSGGPIEPACRTLVITNTSATTISWSASNPEPHFSISTGSGTLAPGQSALVEVCPAAATLGLSPGSYTTSLFVTNLASGAVQRRDLGIQILQLAKMPFMEDFEAEALAPFWTVSGTGLARTLLSTNDQPHGGDRHLTFSSVGSGLYARNEATMAIDLDGYTNVVLRFWAREFNDEPDGPPSAPFLESADFDGVAISVDGYTWYEAGGLRRLREDYSEVVVPLDQTVAKYGLAYSGWFRIRFNQADTGPIPEDGIAIDDISISGFAPRRFLVLVPGLVSEGAGRLAGTLALPVATTQDVIVQLASSDPQVVSVPATVLLRAGSTSATFELLITEDALLDGEQRATISAYAPGFHSGEASLRVVDNENALLSLTVQTELIEGRGLLGGAGRVTLDRAPTQNLLVQLASSDPEVVGVAPGVVIQAGRTSAVFNVFVGDDGALDGPQLVTLSARLTENIEAAVTVPVLDNETTNLLVTVPPLLNESGTTLASVGSVRISGTVPTNVTVSLNSSHTNKVRVPALVTILAGRVSATFNVSLVEDSAADGAQLVTISASAAGFSADDATLRVLDNDTAPLAYNPRPRPFATTNVQGVQLAWDLGVPDLIVNGGFETGDFSGWSRTSTGGGDFVMNSGIVDPPGPEGRSQPYAGRFSPLSVQNSPGVRTISQDVALPIFFDSAVLNWTHRIGNHATEFSDGHFFRVEIRGLDDSLLAIAFSTNPGDPAFSDWQERSFSLQNFRGNTIRIAFVESDSLGFLNVSLDDVRIFLSSPGTVTSEVYVGPHTNLGLVHFQGATTNTSWQLPPLALESQHYWRVITRRGDARTINPVWQFSTRGIGPLHHFAWNPFAPNQTMGRPFPASIMAKDADGNTISNFSRSVFLIAEFPQAADPVQVLTFTGFRASLREYRRTLAAISIHFTNYVETFFTATDPSVLEAQLAGKKVFLVVEQDGAPGERMASLGAEWGPVLRSFVASGGVMIVCSHIRDEHEILNHSDLMQLTKVSPLTTADLRVSANHPLTEGLSPTFSGVNLSSYTSENGLSVLTLSNANTAVVLTRPHGAGHVVMIGTDYLANRTGMDRVVANAVKLAQGPTTQAASVSPPFTGYFQNGRWAGNVTVLAAGSNIVLTADDGQGHIGRSIPLTVAGENDLSVTLTDGADPLTLGSNILYTAQVRNSGPSTATGVVLSFEIPADLAVVNVSSSQGACALNNDTLTCQLGALGPGATAQVLIDASPQIAGTFHLTAVATAAEDEAYPDNNSDTASTSVGYPSIFIFFKSTPEGHAGSSTITFPLQLRPPSSKPVTVHYATSNITAQAGADYLGQSGQVTFAPGQTNQAVSFAILGDRLYEGSSETFAVYLSNPTNAILGEVVATGSISEDDSAPALSILDTFLLEGADGTITQAMFSVQLATNAGVTVRANYTTLGGSASPVLDFLTGIGTISLPPGVTTTNIAVTVKGDQLSETNETFSVVLSGAVNATLARSQGIGTILDDDTGALSRFVWDPIPWEQQYGAPFPVMVTAKDALGNTAVNFSGPVSLAGWAAARQSTVGPGDGSWEAPMGAYFHDQRVQAIYLPAEVGEASRITALALLVRSPPGQTLDRWTIRMKHSPLSRFDHALWQQDWVTVYQNNETVVSDGWITFQFSQPFDYNGVESLLVDFSFNNATYSVDGQCETTTTSELRSQYFRTDSAYGDPLAWSGAEPPAELARWIPSAQFSVERSVEISPLHAESFVNGVWTGNVAVFDVVENMSLRADDGRNHSGSANLFQVVTTNDLAITASDAPDPARAGDTLVLTYRITNSGPATATSLVLSNRMPPAATALLAQASQGACDISAGLVLCHLGDLAGGGTATVTVQAIPHESGFLTNTAFVSSQGSELFLGNNAAATVTRVNPRALFLADVSVTETTDAFTNAIFTARLSSASSNEIAVEYFTSDLTATNSLDYLEVRGLLIFPPRVTNLSVIVPVIGDVNDEPNEVFRLNFANGTNVLLLNAFAVATIVDNDLPPLLTPGDASIAEGNLGPAFFQFPLRVTPASGFFTMVTFTTSNGTATAGSDYFAQTLTLVVPPGFTNRVVTTTIFGDRQVEPDEHFFVHFSRPQNLTLATNVVRGTIINDDGLPGVVEYFDWNHVPSPQRVGQPVPVTVAARDSFGNVVSNFAGATLLRGRAGPADVTVGGHNPQSLNLFGASFHDGRTGALYLTNELGGPRRITGLALDVIQPPGQPLTRWTIRMKHTSLNNFIAVTGWETNGWTTVYQNDEIVDRTGWVPFTFQTPFDYNGTNNVLVDFSFNNNYFTVDGQCRFTATNQSRTMYSIADSDFGDPLNWTGVPGPQLLSGIPIIQFLSGLPVEITPDVTAAFTNGVWRGAINVLEPASNMHFVADDTVGHIGLSAPFTTEFIPDSDGDGLLDEWELAYFGSLNASAHADADADGLTNLQEHTAGTHPLDPVSVLRITGVEFNGSDVNIHFTSIAGRTYRLERAEQLAAGQWTIIADNVPGIDAVLQVTDFNAAATPTRFYRVRLLP